MAVSTGTARCSRGQRTTCVGWTTAGGSPPFPESRSATLVIIPSRIIAAWAALLAFWALPALQASGEEGAAGQYYVVRVWGADEGLTEGSVTDVAQTPEGYLWMGTLFGSVLRFD